MNIKTILTVIAFAVTFSIALISVKISAHPPLSFLFRENNPQTQAKIYELLKKDRQIYFETFTRSEKIPNADPNELCGKLKKYHAMREKLDVSELPKDFQYAWERVLISDLEWVEFISHLRNFNGDGAIRTDAQKEIADFKVHESRRFEFEMRDIASSYGVEFDKDGNLIEK